MKKDMYSFRIEVRDSSGKIKLDTQGNKILPPHSTAELGKKKYKNIVEHFYSPLNRRTLIAELLLLPMLKILLPTPTWKWVELRQAGRKLKLKNW